MKLLADFFPLILFFIAFKWQGIYIATAVGIAASVLQIAWLKWRREKISNLQWIGLIVIVVFGGATLLLHDDVFIRWKPTVVYGLSALVLLGAKLFWRKDLLAGLMQEQGLQLPPKVATGLTWAWVIFFAAMGIANWYVAFHYSLDTWATFKVWGVLAITLVFVIGQGVVLGKVLPQEAESGSR